MNSTNPDMVHRFELFGKQLCGSEHGWKKAYAEKLGITPNHLAAILNGRNPVGGKMQQRLRDLGGDVDYILTGKSGRELTPDNEIRIHYSGSPSEELQLRTRRLAEWILQYGQNADSAFVGYVTQKFLEGKILDSEGKEIN